MSQAAQRVLADFEALPELEQKSVVAEIIRRSAELVEDLWARVGVESEETPFTEEEWAEIEQRRTQYAQDPGSAILWEEVRERLYRRFS